MTSVFRKSYEEIKDDGTLASQLVRTSLLAADAAFSPGRQAYLSVQILGTEAEAYLANRVAASVLDSTVYFARAIGSEDKVNTYAHLTRRFREKIGLSNAGSIGNRLLFRIEPQIDNPQIPLIDESELETLGEQSARSLTLSLPSDERDDTSLENALALTPLEKRGLQKLAMTLNKFDRSIEMGLRVGENVTSSGILTSAQARTLEGYFRTSKHRHWVGNFTGRLDGMRSSRRQFFLIQENGLEIQGTISANLLSVLPNYINQQVEISTLCIQPVHGDGRKGRITYRLDAIEPAM